MYNPIYFSIGINKKKAIRIRRDHVVLINKHKYANIIIYKEEHIINMMMASSNGIFVA